jgi:hypothetical protein
LWHFAIVFNQELVCFFYNVRHGVYFTVYLRNCLFGFGIVWAGYHFASFAAVPRYMGSAIAKNNYGAAAIVAAKLAHLPWAFLPAELLHCIKANE